MKTENSSDSMALLARNAEKAESMLKQLANAKRLMVLCHLVKSEKTVSELTDLIGISQSSLSQHLAKMRDNGLVASDKRGKQVYYRIGSPEVSAVLSTLYLIYCR